MMKAFTTPKEQHTTSEDVAACVAHFALAVDDVWMSLLRHAQRSVE
jgi:hypothetical protein